MQPTAQEGDEEGSEAGGSAARRRQNRRVFRRAYTAANHHESPCLVDDGIDDLLLHLDQHLDGPATVAHEQDTSDGRRGEDKENAIEEALIERMGRAFSQEGVAKRQSTWARTTSMPTDMTAALSSAHSPGDRRGKQKVAAIRSGKGARPHEYVDHFAGKMVLGKRQWPPSPSPLGKEKGYAMSVRKAGSSCKPIASVSQTSPHERAGVAVPEADGTRENASSPGRHGSPTRTASQQRRKSTLGAGRGPPRHGVRRGTNSAPEGRALASSVAARSAKEPKPQGRRGEKHSGPAAPFRLPTRQSPRTRGVAEGQGGGVPWAASSSEPRVWSTEPSKHDVHEHAAAAVPGDASLDTSVDEATLWHLADAVEASQTHTHAPHPCSDDSLEWAMGQEVDPALLASMDAQGW